MFAGESYFAYLEPDKWVQNSGADSRSLYPLKNWFLTVSELTNTVTFKKHLKTHLFTCAFGP